MINKLIIIILVVFISSSNVYANSAQKWFKGTDGIGTVSLEENPLEVRNENLIFDICDFPVLYSDNKEDYVNYNSHVSAEYTIHNPSSTIIQSRLIFPFGIMPEYLEYYNEETNQSYIPIDFNKYKILVDNKEINKTIRCTYQPKYEDFDIEKAMKRIYEGYKEDSLYSLNLPVTKYTYVLTDCNTGDNKVHVCSNNQYSDKTKYYLPTDGGYFFDNNTVDIEVSVSNNEKWIVYVIGEESNNDLEWKVFNNDDKEEIEGNIECIKKEEYSFKDLVFQYYNENNFISKSDWYNAVIDKLNLRSVSNPILESTVFNIKNDLMYWYDYMIEVKPHSTITNTVVAPVFPSINTEYEPELYTYNYLLSPAKTWKDFKNINITIYTDYYLLENNMNNIEQIENGYYIKYETLPDQEIEFNISTKNNLKIKYTPSIGSKIIKWLVASAIFITCIIHLKKGKKIESK